MSLRRHCSCGGKGVNLLDEETMDAASASYSGRVGEKLRAVRLQHRMSLQAVEAASNSEFKASVLGAYERGERAISVPRLERLARFYNVPVSQLLPRDNEGHPVLPEAPAERRDGSGSLAAGNTGSGGTYGRMPDTASKVTIDLTKLGEIDNPEKDLMRRYLEMIQIRRQDFNGRILTIRMEDVVAIGCLFQMTGMEMANRLDEMGVLVGIS